MEKNPKLKVLIVAGLALASSSQVILATGGDWFDEIPTATLGDSLDMLPAKSFGEIFDETTKPRKEREMPDMDRAISAIADRLKTEPPAKLIPEVDKLLASVRENYSDDTKEWCYVLHDVRDVLAGSSADVPAAQEYIRWRLKAKSKGAGVDDLEQRAAAATGPLKAHWLYLCGAALFARGERDKPREWFERVIKEFPDHPRAEMALFMLGRCAFSQSRQDALEEKDRAGGQQKAIAIFQRYLDKYPHGRFVADTQGWLGALAFDQAEYLKALQYYIAQAEAPDHPEVLKSAIFMCETALAHVAAKPDGNAAFELAARHPRIAMGFTYLVLSAPEADNYDGKIDKPADVKKWRKAMLPRIAAAVVKQKDLYKSGDWQPRYLAMLALAASGSGDQTQALKLTEISPDQLEKSDDLLFARALALQRSGKPHDAAAAFGKFLDRFPKSPLADGVRLRLALALQDDHRAGEALAQLKLLKKPGGENGDDYPADMRYTDGIEYPNSLADWNTSESAVYPNLSGLDGEQLAESIDTLLNFAPLPELAAALDSKEFTDAEKSGIRSVLAERYLEQEDFDNAKKYMPPAQFGLIAANLEKLTATANAETEPKEKAAAMLRTGDAWAAARDSLLLTPLDTGVPFLNKPINQPAFDALMRRENGRATGAKDVDTVLEDRDELRHASRWWMRAARTLPATPIAAESRWKALNAMPALAKASDYAETRAREINIESVSRELYDRLRKECPDSVEATRDAVYWSIPKLKAPKQDGTDATNTNDDNDQDFYGYEETDANMLGYAWPNPDAFGITKSFSNTQGDETVGKDFSDRVNALREDAASWAPAKLAKEVGELRDAGRKNFAYIEDASCMNMLDDLALFLAEPGVTQEMQKLYVNIRLDVLHRTTWGGAPVVATISTKTDSDEAVAAEINEALKNPAMKSVADYLEFNLIGLVAGAQTQVDTGVIIPDKQDEGSKPETATYASRDYATMEKMARDFLKKYPKSRKREAAMFVLARSVFSLSRPYIYTISVPPPGMAAGSTFYRNEQKTHQIEPFDEKRVLKPLDDYDREFPNGRYSADIRNYRAYLLFRQHAWKPALTLTLAQLADTAAPDLQPEAGIRLANIFAQLADAKYRADIMSAIKENPAAVPLLAQYLDIVPKNKSHPLRYLQAYLSDQFK